MNRCHEIDQREGSHKNSLHLAQETRPQKRGVFQVKGRAQRQRTSQERQEEQGA